MLAARGFHRHHHYTPYLSPRLVLFEEFIVLGFPFRASGDGEGAGRRGAGSAGARRAGSGVEEAVEGVVGRFQVEQHLPHLGVVELI